ncbi:MAG: hypothetical protein LBM62_07810 [Mediterranea sp.]|jgi:hypothetical protein|nr:hypothetical protein [Mediterranea sp.]
MANKKYKPYEPTKQEVNDPIAAYGTLQSNNGVYVLTKEEEEACRIAEEQFARGEYYTQEEVDIMMKELFEELDKNEKIKNRLV